MIRWYNTLTPYKEIPAYPIQYGVCKDYDHISRYSRLRQVVHSTGTINKFVSLETSNPFETHITTMKVHEVTAVEENRLDLIAEKYLGCASYSWVIAYVNGIEDGYTVREGQKLNIPNSVTDLMKHGELLESVPAMQLNLGVE